jgi:putative ABC transport system permease protein
MGAVRSKISADLRHRRLQGVAIGLVLLLASGAATLALSILVEAQAPFDRAFARTNGAHLVVDYDGAVPTADLSATLSASPVATGAGPWPVTSGAIRYPGGGMLDIGAVSGRPVADPGIDRVTIESGRWWANPGEVVLDASEAAILGAAIGDSVELVAPPEHKREASGGSRAVVPPKSEAPTEPPASVTLTLVGIAASVSTPDVIAWASPADVAALAGEATPQQRMLYRLVRAESSADLGSALRTMSQPLPADAVVDSRTYLDTKGEVDELASLYVPVLLAFSVFALLAAGFMVANVVSGIVLANYRDIGIMKALGFTPADVVKVLLAQVFVPAGLGTAFGLLLGTLASRPTVEATARSFGVPGEFIPTWWILVAVPAIALAVTGLAAAGPAIQAGRISAVDAIAHGRAPSASPDGGRLRRLGLRLPVPLPARLGLSLGLAHPARAAMLTGALTAGVAAATFALGLNGSLVKLVDTADRVASAPVRGELNAEPSAAAEISATIAAMPTTDQVVAIGETEASMAGVGQVAVIGYQGASQWVGYELIRGRWFTGPGEAVAPTNLYTVSGLQIGDRVTLSSDGHQLVVTLVGEALDVEGGDVDGLLLRADWADVTALDPAAAIGRWEMRPAEGTEPRVYATSIDQATGGRVATYTVGDDRTDVDFLLFLSVVAFLGGTLVAVSFGGVFNTVLLETRRLTREVAILKASGSTPAQVVAMVLASIVPAGVVAGIIGVPIGLLFQRAVLSYMGQVAAKTGIPDSMFDVFGPLMMGALIMSGLAIAAAAAYAPAQRAARAPIAVVLQTE